MMGKGVAGEWHAIRVLSQLRIPPRFSWTLEAAAARGSLSELLLPAGYVQIGRPDTGDFDAICFNMNGKSQNREHRIVQIDHEDILCNWKVRVSGQRWGSFTELVKAAVSSADPRVYYGEHELQ